MPRRAAATAAAPILSGPAAGTRSRTRRLRDGALASGAAAAADSTAAASIPDQAAGSAGPDVTTAGSAAASEVTAGGTEPDGTNGKSYLLRMLTQPGFVDEAAFKHFVSCIGVPGLSNVELLCRATGGKKEGDKALKKLLRSAEHPTELQAAARRERGSGRLYWLRDMGPFVIKLQSSRWGRETLTVRFTLTRGAGGAAHVAHVLERAAAAAADAGGAAAGNVKETEVTTLVLIIDIDPDGSDADEAATAAAAIVPPPSRDASVSPAKGIARSIGRLFPNLAHLTLEGSWVAEVLEAEAGAEGMLGTWLSASGPGGLPWLGSLAIERTLFMRQTAELVQLRHLLLLEPPADARVPPADPSRYLRDLEQRLLPPGFGPVKPLQHLEIRGGGAYGRQPVRVCGQPPNLRSLSFGLAFQHFPEVQYISLSGCEAYPEQEVDANPYGDGVWRIDEAKFTKFFASRDPTYYDLTAADFNPAQFYDCWRQSGRDVIQRFGSHVGLMVDRLRAPRNHNEAYQQALVMASMSEEPEWPLEAFMMSAPLGPPAPTFTLRVSREAHVGLAAAHLAAEAMARGDLWLGSTALPPPSAAASGDGGCDGSGSSGCSDGGGGGGKSDGDGGDGGSEVDGAPPQPLPSPRTGAVLVVHMHGWECATASNGAFLGPNAFVGFQNAVQNTFKMGTALHRMSPERRPAAVRFVFGDDVADISDVIDGNAGGGGDMTPEKALRLFRRSVYELALAVKALLKGSCVVEIV